MWNIPLDFLNRWPSFPPILLVIQEFWSEIYLTMHCNTHNEVIDLDVNGVSRDIKKKILKNRTSYLAQVWTNVRVSLARNNFPVEIFFDASFLIYCLDQRTLIYWLSVTLMSSALPQIWTRRTRKNIALCHLHFSRNVWHVSFSSISLE